MPKNTADSGEVRRRLFCYRGASVAKTNKVLTSSACIIDVLREEKFQGLV